MEVNTIKAQNFPPAIEEKFDTYLSWTLLVHFQGLTKSRPIPRENGRWPLNRGWCISNVISLSSYKFLVNMEPIQGNHDRREAILRNIASDSFFPNPLLPFRQGPLPL